MSSWLVKLLFDIPANIPAYLISRVLLKAQCCLAYWVKQQAALKIKRFHDTCILSAKNYLAGCCSSIKLFVMPRRIVRQVELRSREVRLYSRVHLTSVFDELLPLCLEFLARVDVQIPSLDKVCQDGLAI
jgi:hypothetical protein